MAEQITYRSTTISTFAGKYGYSSKTFWKLISTVHLHDMVFLGYRPNDYSLNPMVVKYLTEVVIQQQPRTDVFEVLRINFNAEIKISAPNQEK